MAVSPVYDVKYRGFVHVDTEGGGLPEQPALQRAAKLLKSNQKEARAMHPLFARGLDTDLKLQVNSSGLLVTLPGEAGDNDGQAPVVLNHPAHKIAHVHNINTCVLFLVKRGEGGRFKCHSFEVGNAKTAREVASQTAATCNELFRKVRRSIRRMRSRRAPEAAGAAGGDVAPPAAVDDSTAVREASEEAERDSAGLSAALREAEEDGIESEPSTPVPAGSSAAESEYDNVDFLDGVSDSLASLILGGDAPKLNLTGSEDAELSLDSDAFNFGEVKGEAEC